MAPESYHDYARITGDADDPVSLIVDDFEDNDLSEYSITGTTDPDEGGPNAIVTTSSSAAYNSNYGLRIAQPIDSNDTSPTAESTSGLPNYPSDGDVIEFRMKCVEFTSDGGGANTGLLTGGDKFTVQMRVVNNGADLEWRVSQPDGDLATGGSPVTGEYYRCVLDLSVDGQFTFDVYNEAETNTTTLSGDVPSSLTGGGISFGTFTGGATEAHEFHWDRMRLL